MASYAYDYLGRRISRTIYGSPNVTIRYVYDGDRIIGEYNNSGTLLRKFVYGPGIDEPICLTDVADNNAVYYYHFDGLGSVIALSDVNNVLVERYAYDVFGRPTIRNAGGTKIAESALGNPYLFTGRAYDAESGLYYYRARYYDFSTGRFLQPDPTGYTDGLNLYSYCGNNPFNFTDPSGLYKNFGAGFLRGGFAAIAALVVGAIVIGAAIYACPPLGLALLEIAPYLLMVGGFTGGLMIGQAGTGVDLLGNQLTMGQRGELLGGGVVTVGTSIFGATQIQTALEMPAVLPAPTASSPVGRLGAPLENPPYQPVRNMPGSVGGRQYSGHAFDQMQNRGLTPSVVENTIQNGTQMPGKYPGTTLFYDPVNNMSVVTDTATGRVVTTCPGRFTGGAQ